MMESDVYDSLPEEVRKKMEEEYERETLTPDQAEKVIRELDPQEKIEFFRSRRDKFKEIKK